MRGAYVSVALALHGRGQKIFTGKRAPPRRPNDKENPSIGTRRSEAITDCAIARSGDILRGHEYHYSTASVDSDARFAYRVTKGKGIDGRDGITESNVVGSYLHAHVYSMPHEFDLFVDQAKAHARS